MRAETKVPILFVGVSGIFLSCAFAIRFVGGAQGYPDFYGHVDEIGVSASIWNFFREGTLRPTEFTYPALFQYLVAVVIWALGWMVVPEMEGYIKGLAVLSYADPAFAAVIGRAISATTSTMSLLLILMWGTDLSGRRVGLLAMALASVALIPVQQAHNALPDSTMAFYATACMYLSWRLHETGSWKAYLGAGACAGLVIATKFNGAFVSFGVVAAHVLRCRGLGNSMVSTVLNRRLLATVTIAILSLVFSNPYLVFDYKQYLSIAAYQVSSLDFDMGQSMPWIWIPLNFIKGELGIGVLFCAAIAYAFVKRDTQNWIFLAGWIPSFFYIGSWTRESLHYLLHFYPIMALLAALLIDRAIDLRHISVSSLYGGRRIRVVIIVFCAVAILTNSYKAIGHSQYLMRTDTRKLAADWIRGNLPDGTTIAMTWLPYCPRLDIARARADILRYFRNDPDVVEYLQRLWLSRPAYQLANLEIRYRQAMVPEQLRDSVDLQDPATRSVFSRGWRSSRDLIELGVEYVILPDAVFQRYLRTEPPPTGTAAHFRYQTNLQYFQHLTGSTSDFELAKSVVEIPGRTRGAAVHIYRMRPS